MSPEDIYEEISMAIINMDEEKAFSYANKAIKENMNLLEVVEKGYAAGIRKVGELWEEGEFFLPELMRGAQIMQNCLDLLIPHLQKGSKKISLGTIVIATIEGDIHSIGKTIVATMLRAYGFEVYDLGADVPAEKIVDVAIEKDADIIGVSALLTTTMTGQKRIIDILKERNLNNKFKVILGGAPVTNSWVVECNADGFAENAIEAVKLVKSLLKSY
ncbi:MAG: B12-binding domain-containing protein [Promethearchaeota archaeon]